MKKAHAAPAGQADGKRRKHRPRPTPKWLMRSEQIEAVARSRCLLLLSVLSGQVPVSDAITQAKISRAHYYQLETRALRAILASMNPLASSAPDGTPDLSATAARIEELEGQVRRLEQEKRRTQRLWLLTRKSLRAPVEVGQWGRRRKSARSASRPMNPMKTPSPTPPGGPSP